MSIFMQAIDKIAWLSKKADVRGNPRISISFDNEADLARFKIELERDINNSVAMKYNKIINASEFSIYGINVRLF